MRKATSICTVVLVLAPVGARPLESQWPSDFPAIEHMNSHVSPLSPAAVAKRASKSSCGKEQDGTSQLGLHSGLSTRPPKDDGLAVEQGSLADGTRWGALRRRADATVLYCGFVAVPDGYGSKISVFGVRSHNEAAAVKAVQSGKFFCSCKQLSR